MIHTRGDDIFSNLVYYSPSRSGLRLSYVTRILPESTSSDSLAVLLATAGRPFICMRKQALFFFFFKKKKGAGFGRPSGYYLILYPLLHPSESDSESARVLPAIIAPVNKRDHQGIYKWVWPDG